MSTQREQPVRLRILTFAPTVEPVCTDRLDCPCPGCDADRAKRIARGARPRHADQPWTARRAA